MSWRMSERLGQEIQHYATFPANPVSLRQMVQFGNSPSAGTMFRAAQFLGEELPIRLAHRVEELNQLPDGLNEMPSVKKVSNWYAQSFEELTSLPRPELGKDIREILIRGAKESDAKREQLSDLVLNPSLGPKQYTSRPGAGFKTPAANVRRYFSIVDDVHWPPEIHEYNKKFTKTLSIIKRRHDPVVTTMAQGIIEYKQKQQRQHIDDTIQSFLDRFYMSRIGIRMLIGQHITLSAGACRDNYVGIICTKTSVRDLAQEAIDNARFICEEYYGLFEAPKVQLVCDPSVEFMYVAGHLSHM